MCIQHLLYTWACACCLKDSVPSRPLYDHPRVGWGLPSVSGQTPRQSLPLSGPSSARWGGKVPSLEGLRKEQTHIVGAQQKYIFFFTLEDFKYTPKSREGMLVPSAVIIKHCRLDDLNNRNLFSVCGLEVSGQGVNRAAFSLNTPGRDSFQVSLPASGSSLASGSVTPVFVWPPPSVHVCVQISPFYKDTSHIGLGATLLQCDLK